MQGRGVSDREAKCIPAEDAGNFFRLLCDFLHKLRKTIQWEKETGQGEGRERREK